MAHLANPSETTKPNSLGGIFALLAEASARPRYAYLVLGLIAEAARPDGRAGPWVGGGHPAERIPLRDWLASQLAPLAARDGRRAGLRNRVADRLDVRAEDAALLDAAVEEQALAIGKSNVSRAVSDLVRAGLVRRHYAGRVKDHRNRGGGRQAVYIVEPQVLAAVRSRPHLL